MTWWKRLVWWNGLMLLTLAVVGCAHVISETVRQQVDPTISFSALRANPEAFVGRTVLLGGQIVETHNTPEGTSLEVVQKPLDAYGRPSLTDYSEGRFIAVCDRYLDPAVYTARRDVTIAGRVLGAREGKIGDMPYTYPLISCLEIHLWPRVVVSEPYYGPYPWLYREPWYWDYWRWRHYPYRGPYVPYWWW